MRTLPFLGVGGLFVAMVACGATVPVGEVEPDPVPSALLRGVLVEGTSRDEVSFVRIHGIDGSLRGGVLASFGSDHRFAAIAGREGGATCRTPQEVVSWSARDVGSVTVTAPGARLVLERHSGVYDGTLARPELEDGLILRIAASPLGASAVEVEWPRVGASRPDVARGLRNELRVGWPEEWPAPSVLAFDRNGRAFVRCAIEGERTFATLLRYADGRTAEESSRVSMDFVRETRVEGGRDVVVVRVHDVFELAVP